MNKLNSAVLQRKLFRHAIILFIFSGILLSGVFLMSLGLAPPAVAASHHDPLMLPPALNQANVVATQPLSVTTPDIWYVDTGTGTDGVTCGPVTAPCKTISYAVNSIAGNGDTLRIASGIYTENLQLSAVLTLEGGYVGGTWVRALDQAPTIVDGSAIPIMPGDWDGSGVRYPTVLFEGGLYKMWYVGIDLFGVGRIGYATSPDGIAWTKYGNNPVMDVGATGAWDSGAFEGPFVLHDTQGYKMWYTGRPYGSSDWAIGYATSPDGITWTKHVSNPILTVGSDPWDNNVVMFPWVQKDGSTYRMWLFGRGDDGSGPASYMLYATSSDGIGWTMSGSNPLFGITWEEAFWRPAVIQEGSAYKMWYGVWLAGAGHVGYAAGSDGLAWTKQTSPVLSGTASEWDDGYAADPFVIGETGAYTMYYGNRVAVGIATSGDGVNWTKRAENPVLNPGTTGQWGQPVVDVQPNDVSVVLDGLVMRGGRGADGGGLVTRSPTVVRNSLITGNQSGNSGGIMAHEGTLLVEDSMVLDNEFTTSFWPGELGGAGGIRATAEKVSLVNVLVAANRGDAAIHTNQDLTLRNVTVAENAGDIIFNPQPAGILSVTNSIVYSNGIRFLGDCLPGGDCTVTYSDIQGGYTGIGNIDSNPSFVNPEGGDFQLAPDSPCIDAGTNTGAPDHDLAGHERPLDGTLDGTAITDMGAYEFVPSALYLSLMLKQ